MRFGLFIPQGWRLDLVDIDPSNQWEVMRTLATAADSGPWESLWVYDHFHTVPEPTEEATHEAWTLMSAFAASTSRIRLGQMCTAMAYRNPAYLAKVAATVDLVSGGRVEMGIGAGWYEHEWRAYGYGFPKAGDRLGALDEGVQIFKQAWETGSATLDGTYYQVDGARVWPKPLQDGGIPLWIAGGGEKVTLKIAAKYANYTNFDGTLEGFTRKSELLEGHCRTLGRDFDAIVRSANYNVAIGSSEAEVQDRLKQLEERLAKHVGAEKADAALGAFRGLPGVGTPEQIVENLTALKEKGLGYGIFYFPEAAYDRSSIELFEREVIPALS
ncbi:LLM class F420-dependent oxidoreductase [Rhodococcus sp. BP-252]|uniref:LLM class F420-dependent oxidoreductase n=1 Tax=unclassified Rhodococcus (in: high G+C Gram-positive bacteria) TaxID=192944 RepID=UPI00143061F0|nr:MULTISPECIES: LLM class F420-dependent oxidoreductase [unclassified Rhodococcus (in: high G+C Gram-positive bacteria)]MBY6412696.1 LLM class F420-dependent oxidoreductase [Rhodococcus sp. BP-320]MBY6417506.1 LLM class F420-dependent oxidoreductase [Rhodococcus sp. BP-321]MBY6421716.1 LLM class F420-dependent oxidoreductase [Rhodococcus sp. BP-324]MBY6427455.1 LLM class F420-dependent oxidoreductase [Rhodococcus sp. BP-323]MBY6432694.1 LLM class F420-dependent oxidoreductase [Rhodococcus sp.